MPPPSRPASGRTSRFDALAVVYMVSSLFWLIIALRFVNPVQLVAPRQGLAASRLPAWMALVSGAIRGRRSKPVAFSIRGPMFFKRLFAHRPVRWSLASAPQAARGPREVTTPSGLRIIDTKVGIGPVPHGRPDRDGQLHRLAVRQRQEGQEIRQLAR
jgi:hypothetical protein